MEFDIEACHCNVKYPQNQRNQGFPLMGGGTWSEGRGVKGESRPHQIFSVEEFITLNTHHYIIFVQVISKFVFSSNVGGWGGGGAEEWFRQQRVMV